MKQQPVLRVCSKLLLPWLLLFALYVQFHGEYGPGGGFQAGVIFAAGVVLYALVFGLADARKAIPPKLVRTGIAAGLLLYVGVGMSCLLLGGNFLDYDVLAADPLAGQHLGIFLIELGVGATVASAMIGIFFAFAERRR